MNDEKYYKNAIQSNRIIFFGKKKKTELKRGVVGEK